MKKNIIGLLVAFALILTIAVPGALVVRADETEAVAETVKALTDADCTCDGERDAEGKLPEGFVHGKECPLYVEPVVAPAPVSEPEAQGEDEPEKVCTCVVNEDGTLTYTEGCPVHEAPVAEPPATEAPAAEPTLFDRLMACETYQELIEMLETVTEEELMALTEEEINAIEEKLASLEPQPLPPVVISDEPLDKPVPSEIFSVTVNVDDVAPFGAPVVG